MLVCQLGAELSFLVSVCLVVLGFRVEPRWTTCCAVDARRLAASRSLSVEAIDHRPPVPSGNSRLARPRIGKRVKSSPDSPARPDATRLRSGFLAEESVAPFEARSVCIVPALCSLQTVRPRIRAGYEPKSAHGCWPTARARPSGRFAPTCCTCIGKNAVSRRPLMTIEPRVLAPSDGTSAGTLHACGVPVRARSCLPLSLVPVA